MVSRSWKRSESRIAELLGGERVPVSGRGDGPDIDHDWLSVEVKSRASVPAWLRKALAQARAAVTSRDQLPVAVIHQAGDRHSSDLVVLSLADFVEWFGGNPRPDAAEAI
jgi:hypothetical protein